MQGGKVRCADCGFLGVMHRETRQLIEADQLFRTKGNNPAVSIASHDKLYDTHPVCFHSVVDFRSADEIGPSENETRCVESLRRERQCGKAVDWLVGYTPKDRYEMIVSREMLADQRAWQADQAKLADDRHREAIDVATKSNRGNVWSNISGAVIAAIAAVAVGFIASIIQKPTVINVQPAQTQPISTVEPAH